MTGFTGFIHEFSAARTVELVPSTGDEKGTQMEHVLVQMAVVSLVLFYYWITLYLEKVEWGYFLK